MLFRSSASAVSELLIRLFISVTAPAMIENSLPRRMSLSSLPPPETIAVSSWIQGIIENMPPRSDRRSRPCNHDTRQHGDVVLGALLLPLTAHFGRAKQCAVAGVVQWVCRDAEGGETIQRIVSSSRRASPSEWPGENAGGVLQAQTGAGVVQW